MPSTGRAHPTNYNTTSSSSSSSSYVAVVVIILSSWSSSSSTYIPVAKDADWRFGQKCKASDAATSLTAGGCGPAHATIVWEQSRPPIAQPPQIVNSRCIRHGTGFVKVALIWFQSQRVSARTSPMLRICSTLKRCLNYPQLRCQLRATHNRVCLGEASRQDKPLVVSLECGQPSPSPNATELLGIEAGPGIQDSQQQRKQATPPRRFNGESFSLPC